MACPPDKVVNPDTGNCVKIGGRVYLRLKKEGKLKSAPKKKSPSKKKTPPKRRSFAKKSPPKKKSPSKKVTVRKSVTLRVKKSPSKKKSITKSVTIKVPAPKGCAKKGSTCQEGKVCKLETGRCVKPNPKVISLSRLQIGSHNIYGNYDELEKLQKVIGGGRLIRAKQPSVAKKPSAVKKPSATKCFDEGAEKCEKACSVSSGKCISRVLASHKYLLLPDGQVVVGNEKQLKVVQKKHGGKITATAPKKKEEAPKPKKKEPSKKKEAPKPKNKEEAPKPKKKYEVSKKKVSKPDVQAARKKFNEAFDKCLASL